MLGVAQSHTILGVVVQALRFYDRRDLRLEEVPTPEPGRGQVQVKVTDAGLSQTQVNEFMEGPFIITQDEHPATGKSGPIIPCQEFGGLISAVGEGVSEAMIGKQVAVLPGISCGTCRNCAEGKDNVCDVLAYRGIVGADGGFCEYVVAGADEIVEIDDKNMLTFVEPLLLGVHASKRFIPPADGKVLILGAGAVGCALGAVWQDCLGLDVAIYDLLPERVARANDMGLKGLSEPPPPGDYSIVAEAAGKDPSHDSDALVMATDLCRPGGSVVALGSYFSPQEFMTMPLIFSERSIVSSFAYAKADVEDFDVWKDKLDCDFDALVSRTPLDRLVEDGYYQAELDRGAFTRIVTSIEG